MVCQLIYSRHPQASNIIWAANLTSNRSKKYIYVIETDFHFLWVRSHWHQLWQARLPLQYCRAKQYLLTLQVSRYCILHSHNVCIAKAMSWICKKCNAYKLPRGHFQSVCNTIWDTIPVNTRHGSNAGILLDQHRRRWTSIIPAFDLYLELAGIGIYIYI